MKKHIIKLFIGLLVITLSFAISKIISIYKNLPSGEDLKNYSPVLSTKIFDRNKNLIAELFTEKRTWANFQDIPNNLKLAVLAIEDHNFYKHYGINIKRILKAAIDNIIHAEIKVGGSTITQQLAKTAFLTHKRNIQRKIKELILAFKLEHNFSKNEILEMYLNQVYLGQGAYGVAQAAKIYFDKSINELTLSECAIIAGLIRSPSMYSPLKNPELSNKRKNTVLKRMLKLNYISKEQYNIAKLEVLTSTTTTTPSYNAAPYFVEYIKEQLEKKYSPEILYSDGLTVITTLDLKSQKYAEEVCNGQLSQLDKLSKSSDTIQVALISLDVKTGEILTMVGGRDFKKSQFNRTFQALRQPGSSFKPFVFLAALEHGFTPTSILDDTPLIFINDGVDWKLVARTTDTTSIDPSLLPKGTLPKDPEKIWKPENYNNKYHGKVLLRKALELSLNSCSVQLLMEVGVNTVIEYARKLGITSPLTNTLSLALGSSEVILMEMVSAYSVFANAGIKTLPYSIIEIRDRFGNILETNKPKETIVLSSESSYLITSLLKGVVQHGTGSYANNLGKICAGKTGTTNNCTDAWFIGYTPDIACGVWVGYDTKKSLGKDATGGKISCPIWTEFMKLALKDYPNKDFEKPENIIEVLIDAETGLLVGPNTKRKFLEYFLKGTEPTQISEVDTSTKTVTDITEQEIKTGF